MRRACARSCSTHHARSSNAAASNSKFLNGFVKREPLLTLASLEEAALHRFRPQQIAVSRSDSISRHQEIGAITAVGSPLSLETYWISASNID